MARSSYDDTTTADPLRGGVVHVPRSRGALSGLLLTALGAWGALIPFVGPAFNFGFTPDTSWHWTSARGWLEVLPGVVTAFGGLLLLLSANRITALVGGWLAVAGGVWFIVGRDLSPVLHIGSPGSPSGSGKGLRAVESLMLFDGLGALILLLAAMSMGRLSVRSVRDVRAAQRREAEAAAKAAAAAKDYQQHQDAERRAGEERRLADERRMADQQANTPAQTSGDPRQPGYQQYPTHQYGDQPSAGDGATAWDAQNRP